MQRPNRKFNPLRVPKSLSEQLPFETIPKEMGARSSKRPLVRAGPNADIVVHFPTPRPDLNVAAKLRLDEGAALSTTSSAHPNYNPKKSRAAESSVSVSVLNKDDHDRRKLMQQIATVRNEKQQLRKQQNLKRK